MTHPFRLSQRIAAIKPSITLAVSARAQKLKADGIDVVGFGAGEPDFDTPAHIKEAAKRALDRGETKYTDTPGTPPLRRAIAKELSQAHGLDFQAENVIASCGAKHSLYNLFQVLLDPGDEVIIPAPYWVSYPDMVILSGARPVIVPTREDNGFRMTGQELAAAITPRTRALVFCSPSNPTGAGYSRAALKELVRVIEEHELMVFSDDIYRRLVYGDFKYQHIATVSRKMAELTILVDGLSKTYAMTGWRVGFTAGPAALVSALSKFQGQSTSNINTVAQAAALAALEGPQDCVEEMRVEFDRRRQFAVAALRRIPLVTCHDPEGAFYTFPNLGAYLGQRTPGGHVIGNDVDLCDYLLDEGRVVLVPGSGFGAPGFVRVSYALAMEDLKKGLDRIGEALGKLRSA